VKDGRGKLWKRKKKELTSGIFYIYLHVNCSNRQTQEKVICDKRAEKRVVEVVGWWCSGVRQCYNVDNDVTFSLLSKGHHLKVEKRQNTLVCMSFAWLFIRTKMLGSKGLIDIRQRIGHVDIQRLSIIQGKTSIHSRSNPSFLHPYHITNDLSIQIRKHAL
jgi:hypothetical protein